MDRIVIFYSLEILILGGRRWVERSTSRGEKCDACEYRSDRKGQIRWIYRVTNARKCVTVCKSV